MTGQLTLVPDEPSCIERLAALLGTSWPAITRAGVAASGKQEELSGALREFILPNTSVIVFGSLARREWTSGSDLDWTLLLDGPADPQHHDSAGRFADDSRRKGSSSPVRPALRSIRRCWRRS